MLKTTNTQVWNHVTTLVTELLAERGEEPGPLSGETKINADLGISSVEAIHLMILLEDRVGTPLSFQELAVRDGEYVDDLTLGELRAFVCRTLGVPDETASSGA
jgi:hypothetical protein